MSHHEAVKIHSTDVEFCLRTVCHKHKKMSHCARNFPEQGAWLRKCTLLTPAQCHANFNEVPLSYQVKKVQKDKIKHLKNVILVDCASTAHLLANSKMVSNAYKTHFSLCLGASSSTNATAKELTYRSMRVWFNHQTISNVLSYVLLAESWRVIAHSFPHGRMICFIEGEGWMIIEKLGCGRLCFWFL